MSEFQLGTFTPGSYMGSRPMQVNKRTGQVQVMTERGVVVNSLLRRDEWQLLDTRVQQSALKRLNAMNHLRAAGLVRPVSSFGVLVSQYSQAGEMDAAETSMTGRMAGSRGRVEYGIKGVPIPIVYKDFELAKRELEADRLLGAQLDTSHASAASRVVAEKVEDMIFNGDANVIFGGYTVYGYTTQPNRKTDTAANYGGGDWGTISNIVPTVAGMINALQSSDNNYFGPYTLYVANTQFNQANLSYYSDGSGQTALQRIRALDGIAAVYPSDNLSDGVALLIQMDEDVVDYQEHMGISVVEWLSADGMVAFFRVMCVGAPRVKADKSNRSGICHATGC